MKKVLILLSIIVAFLGGIVVGNKVLPEESALNPFEQVQKEIETVNSAVFPAKGFTTKIVLGDTIQKLIENGVIDRDKFETLYASRNGLNEEEKRLLNEPSYTPLKITEDNADFLINLLWPLGIANKNTALSQTLETEFGENKEDVSRLASTGGWTLGNKENGGDYYNQFEIIPLSPAQDALVKKVAENIYRPCCGNSTAFPDCNHGAALLGVLQLGANQGLTEQELYEEALKFNTFWFPDQYMKMGLAFNYIYKKKWQELDPKVLLSKQYASSGGFRKNIATPLANMPGLSTQSQGGGGCGV